MGNILKKTRLREKKEKYCYISLLFDVNRGGVADIAENILLFLDYESFKNFKRTCKMLHQFIINSKVEQIFIANLPKELSGCLKMTSIRNNFTHNLCDELTRLGPRISFGYGDFNYYPLSVHATPRKLEVVSTPEKKLKNNDNKDQITFEEFIEIYSSDSNYHVTRGENIIGKTPSRVLWDLMQFGNIFQKIKNPDCELCGLGVSPSWVSRWREGYSFWSS